MEHITTLTRVARASPPGAQGVFGVSFGDVVHSVTNASAHENHVRITFNDTLLFKHTLPPHTTSPLNLGHGLYTVKLHYNCMAIACEHPLDLLCTHLPNAQRRAIATCEPLVSGGLVYSHGEVYKSDEAGAPVLHPRVALRDEILGLSKEPLADPPLSSGAPAP